MTTLYPRLASGSRFTRISQHFGYFEFQPLSAHEWRIVDSRHTPESVDALVGFVARHNGAFYATPLRHPLESVPFASLEAVASFFSRSE